MPWRHSGVSACVSAIDLEYRPRVGEHTVPRSLFRNPYAISRAGPDLTVS